MKTNSERSELGRRGFVASMLAGAGLASAALFGRRARAAGASRQQDKAAGPVLYRRTAETDRYFKTLD